MKQDKEQDGVLLREKIMEVLRDTDNEPLLTKVADQILAKAREAGWVSPEEVETACNNASIKTLAAVETGTLYGTGEKKQDRPDKEAIARTIFFHGEDGDTDKWNCLRPNQREVYLKIAKQIIALFEPLIEEAHKEGYEQAVKNIKTPEAEALVNEAIEEAKKQEQGRMIRILKDASYALDEKTWQALKRE